MRTLSMQWYTCIMAIAIILLAGCATIRVPSHDSTPPTIRLGTIGYDEDVLVTEGSADVEIEADRFDRFTVMATAEDRDGGVFNVNISFSETIHCSGSGSTSDGYVDNPAIARVGSTVPVTRAVARAVDMPDIIDRVSRAWCEDYLSIVLTFRGIALNFHDGRADSARITVTHVPE